MKLHFRSLVSIALSAALLLGCVGCGGAPKAPTTITVWTYYSGDQLTSFNELVDEFNSTRRAGKAHRGQKLQPRQRDRP